MTTPELSNRLHKVFALAATIEHLCATPDADALRAAADNLTDWETVAAIAKVNPPSDETIRLVRHFFAERARVATLDPFAGLPQ